MEQNSIRVTRVMTTFSGMVEPLIKRHFKDSVLFFEVQLSFNLTWETPVG